MPHGPSTAAGSSLKSRSFPRQDDDCYLNKEQTPRATTYRTGTQLDGTYTSKRLFRLTSFYLDGI